MKKIFALCLSIVLCLTTLTFFGCKEVEEKTVSLKYYETAQDLIPMLKSGKITTGLLPEPAATNLEKNLASEKTWYRLDVQELFDSQKRAYPQAVLMVKQDVINAFPTLYANLSETIDQNVAWAKGNVESAITAINSAIPEGVVPSLNAKNLTADVIDNCKIYFQENTEQMQQEVESYISAIREVNEQSANQVTSDIFLGDIGTTEVIYDKLTFYAPDGAPAIAIAKYINENSDLGTGLSIEYNVVESDKIGPAMAQGKADIIILPVNAATKLYKTHNYKMISVITHGNLYVLSTEKITKDNLAGKTIGVFGIGLVPDVTLKSALKNNGYNYKDAI